MKEEVLTTEEVVEESNHPSELKKLQARAEEFENKLPSCSCRNTKHSARANEDVNQLQYRSQDL